MTSSSYSISHLKDQHRRSMAELRQDLRRSRRFFSLERRELSSSIREARERAKLWDLGASRDEKRTGLFASALRFFLF